MGATRTVLMTCAVCGADSTHEIVTSSSGHAIDLDGRWHGRARVDRMGWPLSCPGCDYAFFNLEIEPPEEALDSEEYSRYTNDPDMPEDARVWLVTSVVAAALDAPAAASHAALQAAWVMDDTNNETRAVEYRTRAIRLMRQALDTEGGVPSPKTASLAVLADMYRRTGRFDKAARTVREARTHPQDDTSRLMLDSQEFHIAAEDVEAHAIDTGLQSF